MRDVQAYVMNKNIDNNHTGGGKVIEEPAISGLNKEEEQTDREIVIAQTAVPQSITSLPDGQPPIPRESAAPEQSRVYPQDEYSPMSPQPIASPPQSKNLSRMNSILDGGKFPIVEYDKDGNVSFKGDRTDKGPEGLCVIRTNEYYLRATFKDGQTKLGTKKYFDGRAYTGALDSNFREEGQGLYTFVDGRKFHGNFSQGKPHGEGMFTSDKGKTTKQIWQNGKRQY